MNDIQGCIQTFFPSGGGGANLGYVQKRGGGGGGRSLYEVLHPTLGGRE